MIDEGLPSSLVSAEGPSGSPFLPDEDSRAPEPSPWGFRIFIVLAAIYLLYRFGQGIGWLWQRL